MEPKMKVLATVILLFFSITTVSQNTSLCPDGKHPHMIDLGLPSGTKWSCCNVGASRPGDSGDYYSWGETAVKRNYDWSTYKYCNGTWNSCYDLGLNICGTQYDVAHVKWGGAWVMPDNNQFEELCDNCTYKWTTLDGVKGGEFTSKINGRKIFMPAAGMRICFDLFNSGSFGYYWTGINSTDLGFSKFGSGSFVIKRNVNYDDPVFNDERRDGLTVRPVAK